MKTKRKPIVRESRQAPMILVPHRHGHKIRRRLEIGAVALLVATIFFVAGFWGGSRYQMNALISSGQLQQQLLVLEAENEELREMSAVDRHGSELEKSATERVRQENVVLQTKVAELQEEVSFYKGIMAPLKNDKGLRIDKLSLQRTVDADRFRYKVVLTQVANNRSYVSGNVQVRVLGTVKGEAQILPVESHSKSVSKKGAKFKFRYFQDLSGEMILPSGFVPEQVEVIAQSKGKKAMRLERLFDWTIEEMKSDVGQR